VPIRVVIAEENYLVREGIRQVLQATPDLELVGVSEDLGSLEAAVGRLAPEVVVRISGDIRGLA